MPAQSAKRTRATAGSIADCAIGALRMRFYLKLVLHVKGVTMNYRKRLLPILIAVTISALSACGGGLENALNKDGLINPSGKVDKSEFLGTWVLPSSYALSCTKQKGLDGVYTNNATLVFSDNERGFILQAYSDSSCKEYIGDLTATFSLQWVAIQFASRQNVAGAYGQLKSSKLGDKDINDWTDYTYRDIFDVVDGKLALGTGIERSADRFPIQLSEPILVRPTK